MPSLGSGRCDRRYDEHPPQPDRFPFARDRQRIQSSATFQRLRHVTQVMAAGEPGGYHTRLTHSFAVARIGRAVADTLLDQPDGMTMAARAGGLDATVVEAACLAHDLGHPPFAHVGEAELDRLLTAAGVADGFEANAQTFRMVCSLRHDGAGNPGLNLTRATLAAILKYPWLRNDSPENRRKWGAYASEAAELAWARAHLPAGDDQPTLEAQVMDWADLVAYAALDFEDFVRAGSIPLAELRDDTAERSRFLTMVFARRRIADDEQDLFTRVLLQILRDCPIAQSHPPSRQSRDARRCYVNQQIARAIGGVSLSPRPNGVPSLRIDPTIGAAILLLEGLTWHYVIDSDLLVPQREEQRQVIRSLFEALAEEATSTKRSRTLAKAFVGPRQTASADDDRLRIISDYIATMTEDMAIALAREIGASKADAARTVQAGRLPLRSTSRVQSST